MATMKAVRIHEYGGPEVLRYEDAPRPDLQPGDALVRVHAAAVNPVDWKVREGMLKNYLKQRLPLILGWDVSGVVEAVAPDVTAFKPGDEVYSRPDIERDGTYAQFVAIRAAELAPKPQAVDHLHAAAVPLAGITAWQALFDVAKLQAGQTVLIHAAVGGVGSFAVQFAKVIRAHVIGTASGRNQALARDLGVDEFIDYTTTRFEEVARDVDVVFDTIGGETQQRSWNVLRPGGTLVSIVDPPDPAMATQHGARGEYLFIGPNADVLRSIGDLIDAGRVRPLIDRIFPLAATRQAHELSQSGRARGKIVLKVE